MNFKKFGVSVLPALDAVDSPFKKLTVAQFHFPKTERQGCYLFLPVILLGHNLSAPKSSVDGIFHDRFWKDMAD